MAQIYRADTGNLVKQIPGHYPNASRDLIDARRIARFFEQPQWKEFQLADDISRAPFKDLERRKMILWAVAESPIVYGSEDGFRTIATFRIERETPLKLIPV